MDFERLRHIARYVVNILGLALLVLQAPEFGQLLPAVVSSGAIATALVVINTILSWLRPLVPPTPPAPPAA